MFRVFVVVCFLVALSDAAITWLYSDSDINVIQIKSARLKWIVDVGAGRSWGSLTIFRNTENKTDGSSDVILKNTLGEKSVYLKGRENDIELEIQVSSNIINVTFVLTNVTRDDDLYYGITLVNNGFERSVGPFIKLNVLALSFSLTRKPERPMVVVLNNNSTDVDFRWEVSLGNGDIFSYLNFRRYEKDKGLVSGVSLGFYQPGYTNVNTTLYSLDTNVSNGPSSGYVRFTIKDILKQTNNKDGSSADARSIDYVYRLEMKVANILDAAVSDVDMRLLVKVHNFLGPKNVSVNQSEQFNVSCYADGKPTSKLSLVFTNGLKITGIKALDIILTAYKNMSGKYNCAAENEVTTPQIKSAWLNVWYPTDRTICSNKTVLEGDDVQLVCSPNGNPPPDMMWIRNGIIRGSGRTLEIKSVTKSDYGMYTFSANNSLGYKRTSIFLTVQSRDRSPEIANPYKASLVVDEGRDASFHCNASGYPIPNITWSSNGVIIGTQSKFMITRAKKYDTSCYTCKADNGVGEAKNVTICLTVLYPPSNTTIDVLGNRITVKEGESLILNCRSDSRPDATYTWKYNDVLLSSPQNRTLIVKRINRRQSGLYRCEAENRLGSASSNTIEIVVQYLDSLIANGNTNKSYSQSNPVIWFNLSVNAYPSNVSLSCKSSAPNMLTVISNQNTRFSHAKQHLVIVIIKRAVDSGSIVCKAEHITGEREITLDFYRQTTVFREEFSGQFEITNQEWHHDLGKSESNRFEILKGKCTKILKAAYDGITFLASIKIKEFIKGSVIVQFELEVIKQVPDPLLPLKTYIKQNGGEIEGLRIDYSSIQKSKGLKPETGISQTENETIIAAVLGTLFALSIVLNIILIAYLIWVRTKDSRRDSVLRRYHNEEIGQTNDIILQETNFNNPSISTLNNEVKYEPIGRRGLVTSNPDITEYEAVATRTQSTQPPSDADNSVPQYERVHHQGQLGAPSKQPSATYRNIPGGQSGNYDSLSPSTRLPHKGTSQTGEYQTLQRKVVSPQYQSLDDLNRH